MLAAFSQRGWKAVGIERNEEVVAASSSGAWVEITTLPVEELPAEARFDLILMFHVLEHIGDPVQVVETVREAAGARGRSW